MNLFNFAQEHLKGGELNGMLEQVGIDDVGSFVNQFRNQANHEAVRASNESEDQDDDETAGGHSSLNQVHQK
jgi:hypothetical protein